jgi:hypothetical protein
MPVLCTHCQLWVYCKNDLFDIHTHWQNNYKCTCCKYGAGGNDFDGGKSISGAYRRAMALALLVSVSGPKKVSIFGAQHFQCVKLPHGTKCIYFVPLTRPSPLVAMTIICGYIRNSRCTTDINDTSGKFANGVKLPLVCQLHWWQICQRYQRHRR